MGLLLFCMNVFTYLPTSYFTSACIHPEQTKCTCAWRYFDTIFLAADSKPHIISIPVPPPSAISPLGPPAVGETCPSASSWQSSKHFPVSCLMMFNRAVDTYHSLPVTLSKTCFEGSFNISWGEIENVAWFGNTVIPRNGTISRYNFPHAECRTRGATMSLEIFLGIS